MREWQLTTPVCFIIFNRPDVTQRVFEKIREAKPPKLLVVADGARANKSGEQEKCAAARAIINQVDWECEVLTDYSDINLGCRKRISSGLDWVFSQVEEAIILEDDCLPHPSFFRFCEELLEKYRHKSRIMLISGQNLQFGQRRRNYSYYFSRYNHCWGWATWKRAWQYYDDAMTLWPQVRDENWLFDILQDEQAFRYWSATFQAMYEGYDTWDYPWLFACYINQGLSILPNINLVSNIGFGKEGTHATDSNSILANIAVEKMQFPLNHPPFIIRDIIADDFTEKTFYSRTISKKEPTLDIRDLLNSAIYLLDKNKNKINLQNITLVTISSVDIELTLLSLVISNLNATFKRVLFFTSEEIDQRYLELFPQLEIIKVNPIKNLVEYSRFVIKELNSFINTEFCLVTQGDGFIINPQFWSEEFLNYDYIAAPWRKQSHLVNAQGQIVDILDLTKNRVGNGGFSLRSKKLLELCSQLDFDNIKTSTLSEDLIICYYFYEWFQEQGIKFVPLEVAVKFSFEQNIEEVENFSWTNTFGFHGKPHVIAVLNKISQDLNLDFVAEEYQKSNLLNNLKLKDINIVIFPDWSVDQDNLGLEIQQVIQTLATHPDKNKITLLIDASDTSDEEADIFLAAIAMNIMMEEEIDITEDLTISLLVDLNEIQWQSLLLHMNARVCLEHENKIAVIRKQAETIPSYSLEILKEGSAAQFFFELGNSLFLQSKYQEAIEQYQKFQQIQTGNLEFYWNLSECFIQMNLLEQCFAVLQEGIKLYPTDPKLHFLLIINLRYSGRNQEAIDSAEIACQLIPNNYTFKLLKYLTVPTIYEYEEEILPYRQRYIQGLEKLIQETSLTTPEECQNTLAATSRLTNFYLSYQAQNDVDLQRQYGQLLHNIMAANFPHWVASISIPKLQPQEKIRIGYASNYLHSYSGTLWLTGWLKYCNHDQFEIYCYYTGNQPDPITEKFKEYSDFFRHIPHNLPAACEQILADKLHILVYPEIGMDPPTMQMADLRLAPVQCVAWGHPVTTGLPTIDYFLSSELMEGENPQEHYSEKLILLPNIGVAYPQPYIPPVVKARADYGLSDENVIYLCCQAPFKYLPQYDFILAEIASRVPQAKFVFLRGTVLKPRLERAFSKLGLNSDDFCIHLQIPERLDYLMINLLSDVYLDTFTWSGGNTSLEAIACSLPIVTCPGEFMRGRHTDSFLKLLGVTDTIAKNEAEYIDIAVKLGLDSAWRNSIAERMSQNQDLLFEDKTCVLGLEAFYKQVVATNP
jgi:predicted O-linked N-acetylglucosamine transferase (SPINDLY family)